ncbi:MAG: hypothetical protein JRF33_20765 [Deltaproteobacteria bacterium]|nr:hypothetical protein [Deltaproteobacteria bacterium]
MRKWMVLLGLMTCFSMLACERQANAKRPSDAPVAAEAVAKEAPLSKAPVGKVAQIVFVGQKKACDCTRTRIDEGWSVLQAALAKAKPIEVRRIQLDVDKKEVERLRKLRTMLVAPGLYFLDAKGLVVELLQGELDEAQLAALLP